jgi:hypothetical protein
MASQMSSIGTTILEGLEAKVAPLALGMSNMWRYIHPSDQGQEWRRDELGRDWSFIKTWELGVAGAISFAKMAGPDMADVGSAVSYRAYSGVQTYPGMGRSVFPNTLRRTITLKKVVGNMYIPSTILRAQQLSKNFQDYLNSTIRGTAKNLSAVIVNAFFAQRDATLAYKGVIGTITSHATDTTVDSAGMAVTLKAGSSIRRFLGLSGMQYDLFPVNSDTRKNTEPIFIDVIDGVGTQASPITTGGTMKLFHIGAASTTLSTGTDYHLVLRDSGRELAGGSSDYLAPTPLDDIMVDTGNIADWGVSVDDYPLLKTTKRDVSGVLTDAYLLGLVSHIEDTFGPENMPDSIWARKAVWASYWNEKDGQFVINRNGALLDVKDGIAAGSSYSLEGTNLTYMSDSFLPEGTAYGLKMGGKNWNRISPPRIPGTMSSAPFLGGVEFIGPYLFDTNDIFIPYAKVGGADAGAATDVRQAPFEYSYEVIPEQMMGSFRLANCSALIK